MFRVTTKKDKIAQVAEDWKETYYDCRSSWTDKISDDRSPQEIYNQLLKLGLNATEEQIDKTIGTKGWAKLECSKCKKSVDALVHIGDESDYESWFVQLCLDCVKIALAKLEGVSNGT